MKIIDIWNQVDRSSGEPMSIDYGIIGVTWHRLLEDTNFSFWCGDIAQRLSNTDLGMTEYEVETEDAVYAFITANTSPVPVAVEVVKPGNHQFFWMPNGKENFVKHISHKLSLTYIGDHDLAWEDER
tara:strand:+ start:68 stop:448 length:381 start_codon:yes stop_codon:yes gene_type:complete